MKIALGPLVFVFCFFFFLENSQKLQGIVFKQQKVQSGFKTVRAAVAQSELSAWLSSPGSQSVERGG